MEVSSQFHALEVCPRGKAPSTHWIGGWVDLGTGLDIVEKDKILPLLEIEPRLSSPWPVIIQTPLQ
jgi:hypothetical protein